jgi:predicted  nucleic acid-binding Zn-ribbon protein
MEEIKHIISEIKTRATQLKDELNNVRVENDGLNEKLKTLVSNLEEKENEVSELNSKLSVLEQQAKEVVVEEPIKNNDLEIDALVREIDDCINRLKQ